MDIFHMQVIILTDAVIDRKPRKQTDYDNAKKTWEYHKPPS